ncbi:MAG: glyoxylase I family protein [Acidimicrobiales bacterium]|jgi:glyoxylase I family protein
MGVKLAKQSIDLGIVITDSEASLAFYRDLLGFEHVADTPMPAGMNGTMHRMQCGDTLVKLVKLDEVPEARPAKGGIAGATGYRYFTMIISNLAEMTQAVKDAGYKVRIDTVTVRPGVAISMVEDPDGNWVEFVEDNS